MLKPPPMSKQKTAGRPIGSTKEKKRKENTKERKAKHDIICNYMWEVQNLHLQNLHKKDIFSIVFEETSRRMNLDGSFKFPYETALSRIRRNNLSANGNDSPLLPIENEIVELLSCMNKLKRSLTASDGLQLINELIDNTPIQQRLREWKIKKQIYYKDEYDLGRVGLTYWRSFLKRNNYQMRTKSGKKYAVDRANWSSYLNFRDMYLHIKDVLLNDSKIAVKLPVPIWVDRDGNEVDCEEKAFGCKTDIKITKPHMAIMFDEVGSNLSQEGDNANGGERFCCGPNDQPYQAVSTKNQRFTTMAVTRLDGEVLMCVVIIAGKKRELMVESGIDWRKLDEIDDTYLETVDDNEFFTDNYGEDKLLPGVPCCYYQGEKVPGYVAFTEGGGIDGHILCEIFKRIDYLKIYEEERKQGFKPFCLLDGHQSRFDLSFLRYINNPSTRWNVCIGVPYGTALWQVGDSSEQNGAYKMNMSIAKRDLFNDRLNSFQQDLHLIHTDVMPLIAKTWMKSFGNVLSNRKAIINRGWDPYTLALLLESSIRATMTDEMMEWERNSGLFPSWAVEEHTAMYYVEEDGMVYLKTVDEMQNQKDKFNFTRGALAQHVSDTILSEVDRQKARERVQKRKTEGETKRNRIMKIQKKLTAGKLVLEGRSHHLDLTVLEHVQRRTLEREQQAHEKKQKNQLEYLKMCFFADKIKEFYGETDVSKWKRKDEIAAYLKPLRQPDDSKMPIKRKDLEERYHSWSHRNRMDVDKFDDEVKDMFENWKQNEQNDEDGSSGNGNK